MQPVAEEGAAAPEPAPAPVADEGATAPSKPPRPYAVAPAFCAWRSGAMRTTSQARPSFSSVQIT